MNENFKLNDLRDNFTKNLKPVFGSNQVNCILAILEIAIAQSIQTQIEQSQFKRNSKTTG